MRKTILLRLFAGLLLSAFSTLNAAAQSAGSRLGCKDPVIRKQAEDIKQHYLAQGFEVMRDAMITMNSQEPFPINLQLNRGELYEIVFIANKDAQRLKLEVYTSRDELVNEQQSFKDQPNFIIYTFSPERNDLYFISIMQRLKSRDGLCGSLFVLRHTKGQATVTPYTGTRPTGSVE